MVKGLRFLGLVMQCWAGGEQGSVWESEPGWRVYEPYMDINRRQTPELQPDICLGGEVTAFLYPPIGIPGPW